MMGQVKYWNARLCESCTVHPANEPRSTREETSGVCGTSSELDLLCGVGVEIFWALRPGCGCVSPATCFERSEGAQRKLDRRLDRALTMFWGGVVW